MRLLFQNKWWYSVFHNKWRYDVIHKLQNANFQKSCNIEFLPQEGDDKTPLKVINQRWNDIQRKITFTNLRVELFNIFLRNETVVG
jgi:hypothetical protein